MSPRSGQDVAGQTPQGEARIRRRRRRYMPGPDAAPEIAESALSHDQWVAIHTYRNASSRERTGGLDAVRKATVGPLLDELEERARREGIPAHLMNQNRPSFRRDANGKLAGPLQFGHDVDVISGETRELMPALSRSSKRPPAPSTKPAGESFDDLEFRLRRSIELADEARAAD